MSIEFSPHTTHEHIDEAKDSVIERLIKKLKAAERKANQFFSSPQIDETKKAKKAGQIENLRYRVQDISAKLIIIGGLSFFALEAAQKLSHSTTPKYSITETRAPNGHITFAHEDKETTEILNWVTGYGPMPAGYSSPEIRADIDRQILNNHGFKHNPSDFETMNEEQVRAYTRNLMDPTKEMDTKMVNGLMATSTITVPTFAPNPTLYTKLWKLQERLGAPKIRWIFQEENVSNEQIKLLNMRGRAHYDSYTNTIYLPAQVDTIHSVLPEHETGLSLPTIVAEDSHAQQFVNQPFLTRVLEFRDGLERFGRNEISGAKTPAEYQTNYDKTYKEWGTLEHNAHSKIEPSLWKEIGEEGPTNEREKE